MPAKNTKEIEYCRTLIVGLQSDTSTLERMIGMHKDLKHAMKYLTRENLLNLDFQIQRNKCKVDAFQEKLVKLRK